LTENSKIILLLFWLSNYLTENAKIILVIFCFRIFRLKIRKFLHCHIATPFLYIFPALTFFLSLLYISVLFTSLIYILFFIIFFIILHGNVAMVAMVF